MYIPEYRTTTRVVIYISKDKAYNIVRIYHPIDQDRIRAEEYHQLSFQAVLIPKKSV